MVAGKKLNHSLVAGLGAVALIAMGTSGALAQAASNCGDLFAPAGPGTATAIGSAIGNASTAFLAQNSAFVASPPNAAPDTQGGGWWFKAVGGRVTTDSTLVATGTGFVNAPNCGAKTTENYFGVQAGRDVAKLNVNGWNFHLGATVGYAESHATTSFSPSPLTAAASPLLSTTQVPFIGSYLVVTGANGVFADVMIRRDLYQTVLNNVALSYFNQEVDARGWSVAANAGFQKNLANNWFIEPSVGFVWSRVDVDPYFSAAGGGFAVNINQIQSTIGRASLRFGTSYVSGNLALQPFASVSVFHEFANNITGTFGQCPFGGCPAVAGLFSVSRVGTYGQLSAGMAGQVINTGWLGFVRGDLKYGEDIRGIQGTAGIRYQFMPEPVPTVGKGPVYKAPIAAVAAIDWSGFYLGPNIAAVAGQNNIIETNTGTVTARFSPWYAGVGGGGQAGYNIQRGRYVFGIELDADWTNAHGSSACPSCAGFFNVEEKMHWLASVTGRAGFTWDRALFYVKAGFAETNVRVQTVCNTGPGCVVPPSGGPVNGTTKSIGGWTAGFGGEFAITRKWSAKGEWMYFSFPRTAFPVDAAFVENVQWRGSVARVGLNYHFNKP